MSSTRRWSRHRIRPSTTSFERTPFWPSTHACVRADVQLEAYASRPLMTRSTVLGGKPGAAGDEPRAQLCGGLGGPHRMERRVEPAARCRPAKRDERGDERGDDHCRGGRRDAPRASRRCELGDEVVDGREALGRIHRERASDRGADPPRHRRVGRLGPERTSDDRGAQLFAIDASEGPLTVERLVERAGERPLIGARIDGLTPVLLRAPCTRAFRSARR